MANTKGQIFGINGPVVKVKGSDSFEMQEMVYVGNEELIGEVIGVTSDTTIVQVYEETTGLKKGEPVVGTGGPLSITLAPGILSDIFDGIERPLKEIRNMSGSFIGRGLKVTNLDERKTWNVEMVAKQGDYVTGGDIIAVTQETSLIEHRIMIPPNIKGKIEWIAPNGNYTIVDIIAKVKSDDEIIDITMKQKWPIKKARPYTQRQPISRPLVTGQRVIDTMFPLAKGGAAAVPGGFGTGKTMTQHQLAKWCDADIIVYIGCGERGNEMTQVLDEFSELIDPKSNRPLLDRTMLIANTSNMPVAAREASIYTGITIAEYFRDMGYSVALMADSTSRWAEALREMSGRLEEMPGEEGYPAYLGSRLAQFYERAGRVITLGSDSREGALSVIGAVSPPGGDISEPVSQATLRIVKVFWGLDANLAYKRHFPAVNWLTSYSLYVDTMANWFNTNVAEDWMDLRARLMRILQDEAELEEIVKLVGMDALSAPDRLKLEAARSIREDFLHQNAFHETDTYTSLEKQHDMMLLVVHFYDQCVAALDKGAKVDDLIALPVREKIGRFKYTANDRVSAEYDAICAELSQQIDKAIENKEDF